MEKIKNTVWNIVFALLIGSIAFLIIIEQMKQAVVTDVPYHTLLAESMHGINQIFSKTPYPLYHVLVKVIMKIAQIPANYSAALVVSACNVFVYIITYYYLVRKALKGEKVGYIGVCVLGLMLAQAIYMPWFNPLLYLGQGSINIWHNPTYAIAKPFAILVFWLVEHIYDKEKEYKIIFSKEWWLLLVCMLFSNLAKPSFFQVFVPGLGIFMLWKLISEKGKKICFHIQIASAFIPATIFALYQAYISLSAGIELDWMGVWKLLSPNPWISVLLFMAFPLYIFCAGIKDWNNGKKLSVCIFLTGFLEAATLAEAGARKGHGNFFWGYYLGGALMWLVSVKEFIGWHRIYAEEEENKKRMERKLKVGWTFFLLHMFSGIYYVYLLLNGALY